MKDLLPEEREQKDDASGNDACLPCGTPTLGRGAIPRYGEEYWNVPHRDHHHQDGDEGLGEERGVRNRHGFRGRSGRRGSGLSYWPILSPPSTLTRAPVVKLEAGLARKRAAVTISSGRPGRPSALSDRSRASGAQALAMSVRNGPGESVLTRTEGPYSAARERVIALRAAFALP